LFNESFGGLNENHKAAAMGFVGGETTKKEEAFATEGKASA